MQSGKVSILPPQSIHLPISNKPTEGKLHLLKLGIFEYILILLLSNLNCSSAKSETEINLNSQFSEFFAKQHKKNLRSS